MANGNRSTFSIKFIIIVCHILIKIKIEEKNIVILGTEMLFLFLQKNGIIIVKIKKGSGGLSFFIPKKRR